MNKIYAFLVCLVFLASSCKDPCDEINCNFGNCLEGTCLCDDGYEGANCDVEEREKFIGTWIGDVDCGDQLGENQASFIVSKDPNSTTGLLFELGFEILPVEPLEGTVSGDMFFITSSVQSIEILDQSIDVTIGGEGDFNEDGTVNIRLLITTVFGVFDCGGVLSPQ